MCAPAATTSLYQFQETPEKTIRIPYQGVQLSGMAD